MKILRIIILLIPIIIILSFVYTPKYLQELFFEGPYLHTLLENLEKDIETKIHENKYYADEKIKNCDWLFRKDSN